MENLKTAAEMLAFCELNETDGGALINQNLSHFEIVSKELNSSEICTFSFTALFNGVNFAFAVTDNRIIYGRKALTGPTLKTISFSEINDITIARASINNSVVVHLDDRNIFFRISKEYIDTIFENIHKHYVSYILTHRFDTPFSKNDANSHRNILFNCELEMIDTRLTQLYDSVKLVNTTVKPDVFFKRLNFILDILLDLQRYERFHVFKGDPPSYNYNKILDNLESTVNDFIDRSYQKAIFDSKKLKTTRGRENKLSAYFSSLDAAFELSHTFWEGNKGFPHYSGPLYTENNYMKLKDLENTFETMS